MADLPEAAAGLRLCRINSREQLTLCETVMFSAGRPSVETVLMRAKIAGRVEVGGEIHDHFADVMDPEHSIIETVALDAKSYRSLKTKWMPCRVALPNPGEKS